jgi:hypothetical protein
MSDPVSYEITWRLGPGRAKVRWRVQPAHIAHLLEEAKALRDGSEAGVPPHALADAAAELRALRVRTPGLCLRLAVRKASRLVQWESPLAALQRAQGLQSSHAPGRADVALDACDPLAVYSLVARFVRAAVEHADDVTTTVAVPSGAGPSSAAGGSSTTSSSSVPAGASTATAPISAVLPLVHRDLAAYEAATAALAAQRARVAAGGEPWTRAEQFAKYGRLSSAVTAVRARTAQRKAVAAARALGGAAAAAAAAHYGAAEDDELDEEAEADAAVLAAEAAGRAALGLEAVAVAGDAHGHSHGHSHGPAGAHTPIDDLSARVAALMDEVGIG